MSGLSLRWKPPGPVCDGFMQSRAKVHGINGPIGSGKTSTALMKIIMLGVQQQPSTVDGVRKVKVCVVRDTYRNLWKTTIPSWWKWVSQDTGDWVGAVNNPAKHTIRFQLPDKTMIELIVEFVAIGDNAAEDVMRGYEPTAFYLNEADLLAEDVLPFSRGRAGRYPGMNEGGPTWFGVFMDFNAPEFDTWLDNMAYEDPPAGFEFFFQPGAFDPGAENLENLPPGYYEDQMVGQPDWYLHRMIHNKRGYSRNGKPVYTEFNDRIHVAESELQAVGGIPLVLGLDAGMTPAATVHQRLPNGQWRALDELVPGHMGPSAFGEHLARMLKDRFEGFSITAWADPSAAFGGQGDDKDWITIVSAKSGIKIKPAPSNNLTPRLDAVRLPLGRMIDGVHPGLIISPRCKILRRGFNSGYKIRRLQGAEGRFAELPEKNEFSHPHDAVQYALLGGGEYHEVMGRKKANEGGPRQTSAITEDNPAGSYAGTIGERQVDAILD